MIMNYIVDNSPEGKAGYRFMLIVFFAIVLFFIALVFLITYIFPVCH